MSWKPPAAWPPPAVARPETHANAEPKVEPDAPADTRVARETHAAAEPTVVPDVPAGAGNASGIHAETEFGHDASGGASDGPVVVDPPRVFISYRRADTESFVEVLDRRLSEDLTSVNVYRDTRSNIVGEPWAERIESEIDRSDAVMVVVGPRWTGPEVVPVEKSRLWQTDDMVRREVALALQSPNRSSTLPIVVDGTSLPAPLPADVEPLRERHFVCTDASELGEPESATYQQVLVGVWNAKKEAVPNGVIVFGGESAKARAVVAEIVNKLQHQRLSDLTQVTQYACNARVLSSKGRRWWMTRKYHKVIIVVDEESADSPVLAARINAIARLGIRDVVVVAVGGGLVFGAGVVTGTGALAGIPDKLVSALSALGPTKVVGSVGKLTSWWAMTTLTTKATVIAAAAGTMVGGVKAVDWFVDNVINPDPVPEVPLAGDWSVGEFTLNDFQFENPGNFEIVPGGLMSFEPVDQSCTGETCALELVDGPAFMRGAIFTPSDDANLDVRFPDERGAIATLAPHGFSCRADGADLTPSAELGFDARLDEETDDLKFVLEIHIPPSVACNEGFLKWSADATRVPGS